jgi:hypothetical protein
MNLQVLCLTSECGQAEICGREHTIQFITDLQCRSKNLLEVNNSKEWCGWPLTTVVFALTKIACREHQAHTFMETSYNYTKKIHNIT